MFTGLMSTISAKMHVDESVDIEALRPTETSVANVQIPEVDSKIVGGNICLLIGID